MAGSQNILFGIGAAEKVRIDSSGNVGIGTSSPNFQVSFGANIGKTLAVFENAGSSVYGIGMGGAGTAGDPYRTKLFSNGTENVCITDSGNVGIGTTTPIRKLTVSFPGSAEFVLQDTTQAANSRNWRIYNGGTSLVMGTLNDAGTAGNDYLTINSSGNVGIGTASPSYKLHVSGSHLYLTNAGNTELMTTNLTGTVTGGIQALSNQSVRLGSITNYPTEIVVNNTVVATATSAGLFQFNSDYGSVATAYGCRVWCQYNQSATIVGAGNVSSITIITTGDVRLNFATALVDANYSAVATTNESGGGPKWCNATQPSTTTIRIVTFNPDQSKGWFEHNFVAVFR